MMRRTRNVPKTVQSGRRVDRSIHRSFGVGGFTLVEMLVAVTLVLIMMAMFAEIFQIAGGSIAKTRGLAENDQRSRTLQTIIKADLDKRSFGWVYPFAAGEVEAPESNFSIRKGYFYISENNPFNSLDDVLQFTVESTNTSRNKDESPYYGQALQLSGFTYPNQPDADDGDTRPNNTGSSTVAEVVYFVRNGNLYRRQLLVREQLSIGGSSAQPDDSIPITKPKGTNVFGPILAAGPPQDPVFQYSPTGPFWNDFDYSAYYNETPAGTPTGANFVGSDLLNNSGTLPGSVAIAKPQYRFGFSPVNLTVGIVANAGRPKEFRADSTTAEFIGRFTLQECSDPDFRYPQNKTVGGMIPTNPTLTHTLDPNDKTITGPDDFSQGSRRGEDLLLSNVHAFDILVWDENYGGFVNIGDPNLPATSDFVMAKQHNTSYGPRPGTVSPPTVVNAVFDTWHPAININPDNNNDGMVDAPVILDDPPFRPITFRPDYAPYTTYTEPTPSNGPRPKVWTENTAFLIGDVVFPTAANNPTGVPFYYRCIDNTKAVKPTKKKGKGKGSGNVGRSGLNPEDEPVWPRTAGLNVEDNTLAWQAVDNRKPLKAIKLEIRFIDASTQQLRQLTIVHSLTD